MSQPEAATVPPRARRRRRWLRVAALVLLPLLLVAGFYLYLYISAEWALQAAVAEADRLEAPHGWRLEDLEARRADPPEGRNSADTVLAARRLLPPSWPAWDYSLLGEDQEQANEEREALRQSLFNLEPAARLDEAQAAALRQELTKAAASLDEARKLAGLPAGRFPITYAPDFISTVMKHPQDARQVAELLGYDALLRAQEQDPDGALTACRALLNAGRSLGDEPMMISQLVRLSSRALAVGRAERALAQGEPSPESLRALQQALEDEEPQDLLLTGARGERAGQQRLMLSLEEGGVQKTTQLVGQIPALEGFGEPQVPTHEVLALYAPGAIKSQHAALLRYMTRVVEAAKLPVEQLPAEMARLAATLKDQPLIVRLVGPSLERVAAACQRSHAQLRCAIAALAAERYRQAHGRWPESLDALVQDGLLTGVPADPYDGAPLRLRRLGDGLVVYSVGPDRHDDGGTIDRKNPNAEGSDLGFRLWDVDRRRQPPLPKPAADPPPPEARER
jgi:hypothetical protein